MGPILNIPLGVLLSPSNFFWVKPFFPIEHLKWKSSKLRVCLFLRIIKLLLIMNQTKIILYDCIYIYNILKEINDIFKFDLIYIEKRKDLDDKIKDFENFIIVTKTSYFDFKNQIILNELPQSIEKIIERINLGILKYNFYSKSNIELNKYLLNLNSKEISFNKKIERLTEQEIKILVYLRDAKKPISVSKLQKDIWGFNENLETHTVETHIHRLRKKILNAFDDEKLIISTPKGYKIGDF